MRRDQGLNYAALLGIIAAASFAAPLLTGLGVSLGLSDSVSAPASLVLAVAIVAVWLLAARGDKPT